jgi:hypothetical protein
MLRLNNESSCVGEFPPELITEIIRLDHQLHWESPFFKALNRWTVVNHHAFAVTKLIKTEEEQITKAKLLKHIKRNPLQICGVCFRKIRDPANDYV